MELCGDVQENKTKCRCRYDKGEQVQRKAIEIDDRSRTDIHCFFLNML